MDYEYSGYISESSRAFLANYLAKFRSDETRISYLTTINFFCNYIKKDIVNIQAEDCIHYISYLEAAKNCGKIKMSTLCKKKKQLSSLYSYMAKEDNRQLLGLPDDFRNFFMDIKLPATGEIYKYERVPDVEDLDKLYCYLRNNDTLICMAFLFAFKCFLTTSEMLRIKTSDIFYDSKNNMVIRIQNPDIPLDFRYNLITPDFRDILLLYLEGLSTSSNLFIGRKGRVYTSRTLRYRLAKACIACGIKNYNYNDLRNAGTVYSVSFNADISDVAAALGHKSNIHIKKLDSLVIHVNDAASCIGIQFKKTL